MHPAHATILKIITRIPISMHTKDSVFVHQISPTVQAHIAFPAIFPDFGTQIQENVKAVNKTHTLILIKNLVSTAP